MTDATLAVIATIAAWCLSYPAAWLGGALGAVDRPGPRRINSRPTPRLGGVAVFGAVLCALALCPRPWGALAVGGWPLMAVAAGAVFAVGLTDDLRTLGVLSRLIVEAVAALAVALGFARFGPWPGATGTTAGVGLSVLWLVAVSNGANLIDGLDGLAAGVALLEIAGLAMVAAVTGGAAILRVLAIAGGAWAGFWLRNRHPARIFAGDGGALLAGFGIAVLALRTMAFRGGAAGVQAAVLVMAYPLVEVLVTVGRRIARSLRVEPSAARWRGALAAPFVADRDHIHHRLLDRGWSHAGAVRICHLAAALMVAAGVATGLRPALALPVACVTLATLAWFLYFLGYLEWTRRARGAQSPADIHRRAGFTL